MWSPDRRTALLGALALGGCGFAPVYGTGAPGGRLLGAVALPDPDGRDEYNFNQRFEERLGRGAGPYQLSRTITVNETGLGSLSDGQTTRYQLTGRARYALSLAAGGEPLIAGHTDAFTAYSATGSSASRQASERDAYRRLMVMLADQVIDRLLIDADQLAR